MFKNEIALFKIQQTARYRVGLLKISSVDKIFVSVKKPRG